MKYITTIILGAALSLNLGVAQSAQTTASMTVTATVVDSCTHTAPTDANTSTATNPVSSKCSTGTTYTAQVKKAPAESKQLNTKTNTVETVKTNENTRIVEIMY